MPPSSAVCPASGGWENLLYPELYDCDMIQVALEYCALFWHYDLSAEEAASFLSHSTLK